MIDQEGALFHDDGTGVHINDVEIPLPDDDALWSPRGANEWRAAIENRYKLPHRGHSEQTRPPSLRAMWNLFLEDQIDTQVAPTMLQLSLLLQPLQALVYEYVQFVSLLPMSEGNRWSSRLSFSAAMVRVRAGFIQSLLRRWFRLAKKHETASESGFSLLWHTALIKYHLICLNTTLNFPEVERLAQAGLQICTSVDAIWLGHQYSASDHRECVLHCGQILRLVRELPEPQRPAWLPGAVYRTALVLASVTQERGSPYQQSFSTDTSQRRFFALDNIHSEARSAHQFLARGESEPVLTDVDGSYIRLDEHSRTLSFCSQLVDAGPPGQLSDGIRLKLENLAQAVAP